MKYGFIRKILGSELALRLFEVIDRRSENRVTEFGVLAQAFEFCKINQIQGDYFEFGVWRGKTFSYARTLARRYGYGPLTYHAFDSFQGLPNVNRSDLEIWHEGQFTCSKGEFQRILEKKGFGRDEYEIVEGFYNDSLNDQLVARLNTKGTKASVVYIDCDLYESTVDVLNFLPNFLQDGTILCFDDFFNYRGRKDMGVQKAFSEVRESLPELSFTEFFAYSPLGMSFICNIYQPAGLLAEQTRGEGTPK